MKKVLDDDCDNHEKIHADWIMCMCVFAQAGGVSRQSGYLQGAKLFTKRYASHCLSGVRRACPRTDIYHNRNSNL